MQTQPETNQAAFRRLKAEIDRKYPAGHWVAINNSRLIADAPTIDELEQVLLTLGQDSVNVLVARAGGEYPEKVTILVELHS